MRSPDLLSGFKGWASKKGKRQRTMKEKGETEGGRIDVSAPKR